MTITFGILVGLVMIGLGLALNRRILQLAGLNLTQHTHDIVGIVGILVGTIAFLAAYALTYFGY